MMRLFLAVCLGLAAQVQAQDSCPANLDGNAIVDVEDLLLVLHYYGVNRRGDTDGDFDTDIEDLLQILSEYGSACTPVVFPTGPQIVSCGNANNDNCLPDSCEMPGELHEVRCCSDVELPGYQQRNGCDVWAESQFLVGNNGCVHDATLDTAVATCFGDGARLCTLAEVQDRCTAGTGCDHDADMIWTSEGCDACAAMNDVAVALAYCEGTPAQGGAGAGTPEASVYGICMEATSDPDVLQTICDVEGVSTTAHMICSDLGYGSGTCDDVAALAVGTFGEDCDVLAANAPGLCPQVLALVAEDTCQEWAEVDGPNLGLASESIMALVPANAVTTVEYCLAQTPSSDAQGQAQAATEAACNSISDPDLIGACDTLGASNAVYTLCLDLGFDSGNCDDAVAMFEGDDEVQGALQQYGCLAFPDLQPGFCALASTLTAFDEDCAAWQGLGYVGHDTTAFNIAVGTMELNELSILSGVCSSIEVSEECADHPMGHVCGTLDLAATCGIASDVAVALAYCQST
eukprot:COSAG05_NODE_4038_length_1706_cov_0.938395_1_plen_517_part_01